MKEDVWPPQMIGGKEPFQDTALAEGIASKTPLRLISMGLRGRAGLPPLSDEEFDRMVAVAEGERKPTMKRYAVQVKKTITFIKTIEVEVEEHECSREAEDQARGRVATEKYHWTEVDESDIDFTAVYIEGQE